MCWMLVYVCTENNLKDFEWQWVKKISGIPTKYRSKMLKGKLQSRIFFKSTNNTETETETEGEF